MSFSFASTTNDGCRYLGVSSVGSLDHPGGDDGPRSSAAPRAPAVTGPPPCSSLTGLAADQLAVCRHSPAALRSVTLGAQLGLMECQFQFQHERWNCSPAARHINQSLFDSIVRRGRSVRPSVAVGL